ncbi:MAG TPA: DNA replication/repair protein RecF [Candidatus Caccenecus avistercoris]|nr:DNA replication/repair protein RecF [Candidatus Caccenecus avistercoris]
MQISSLKLLNFRNYETLELKFSNKVNLIYGKNGMGKTNIIEAIYMLGLTKTFRSNNDDIVIKKGKNIAKIEGTIKDNIFNNYKIIISNAGKRIKIDNNKIAKVSDYITKVNIILFNPDDLKLIKDTPSIRRKMLNIEISGINGEYLLLLNSYNKVLKQRNAYLKALNKKKDYETSFLNILTEQLVDLGLKIMWIREDFINNINSYISDIYYEITHKGTLKVVYKSEFLGKNKEDLLKMFEKNISREIFLGKTIFGIQHDDLEFQVDSEIVKEFSSVGEQKNSIISFKLAEIKNIEEKLHKKPILILDDLFSELDEEKINNILMLIDTDLQTFITTTEITKVDKRLLANAKIFHVIDGKVEEE